jgi:hypothetical protein
MIVLYNHQLAACSARAYLLPMEGSFFPYVERLYSDKSNAKCRPLKTLPVKGLRGRGPLPS